MVNYSSSTGTLGWRACAELRVQQFVYDCAVCCCQTGWLACVAVRVRCGEDAVRGRVNRGVFGIVEPRWVVVRGGGGGWNKEGEQWGTT